MSAFAWVFVSLFSTAEPVTAVPPAMDAFGRDLGAVLLPLDVFSDSLGSDRWAEFAADSFYNDPKHQPALAGLTLIMSECSQSFRRERPRATAEDYDGFLTTQEGMAFSERCAAEVGKDPEAAKQIIVGNLFMVEAMLAITSLTADGLTSVLHLADEVSPEARLGLESWIRERLDDHWQRTHCVVSKVAAQFEPAKILVLSEEFLEAALPAFADMESCKWPAFRPLPAAVKAETRLPFDGFERILTLESELLLQLEKQPGSEEWAELAVELVQVADPDSWKRALWGLEADGYCSREYRRENPKRTADDFDEFMTSAEGRAFQAKCLRRYQEEPGQAAARRETLQATAAVGNVAGRLLSALPGLAEELGVEEQDSPELRERALGWARAQVPFVRCLVQAVMNTADFDLVADFYADDLEQKRQARTDAANQVCLPADGSFDAFGRYIDMQASLAQEMRYKLDSPDLARQMVRWVTRNEDLWSRLQGEAKLRSDLSVAYRALKPQGSAQDFADFKATEAGKDLRLSLVHQALKDPQRAETTRQTLLALLTLNSSAPIIAKGIKQELLTEDFAESPEKQPSLEAEGEAIANAIFTSVGCVYAEAAKAIPIEEIYYTRSQKISDTMQAISASGICNRILPKG